MSLCTTSRSESAPVDEAVGPVDEPLSVKRDEGVPDCPRQHRVEREALARPVAGSPQSLGLVRDVVLVLCLPLPHPLEELLAPQFTAARPFLGELALDHHLRGDSRVVGPRQPERVVALHAPPPDHQVLEGELERVADVQLARDVRRWDQDHVWRPVRGLLRGERARSLPFSVPLLLERGWVETSGQRFRTAHASLRTPCGW